MKLIHKICILLLINFAAGSSEPEDTVDPCEVEYIRYNLCYTAAPNPEELFRELNATMHTGSEDDLNELRSIANRYCEKGHNYLQCFENITKKPECEITDDLGEIIQVFADKLIKFGIEYACRNDAEAVFKMIANNRLNTIINIETADVLDKCLPVLARSDNIIEAFCRHIDTTSACLLEQSDKMINQEISAMIRDVIPQLKEIGNCVAAA